MRARRTVILLAAAMFALVTMGQESCETSTEDSGSNSDTPEKASDDGSGRCGTTATDDCTPRVGPKGRVRVDALLWRVTGVSTAETIGDLTYGLGEKANGVYVIVNVEVTSRKNESATLSDESIVLEAGQNSYSADSDGTIAALGEGEDPLFFDDISPDATLNSKVVFDVPSNVLNKKVFVRFNELGFGSTHGFIRLPRPSAG
jgi:hypothetical protein